MSPSFRRKLFLILTVLGVFHLAAQLGGWLPLHWQRTDRERDLTVYYDALRRLRTGQPLYQPWPDYVPAYTPSRYFYPPPFAAVFAPLGGLSFLWFARLWYLLLLASFWIYAWCLARLASPAGTRVTIPAVLIAGLILDLWPRIYWAMSFGNAEPMLWALFGLSLATPNRGAALAGATLIKLHALWPLLLAIRHEGRRVPLPALLVIGFGLLLGWLVCGMQSYLSWWPAISPVLRQGTFNPDNISLSFAVLRLARLLGWDYNPADPLPRAAQLYLSLMAVAGPLFLIWLVRRQKPLMQYACVGAGVLLFAPLCWTMYLALLLAPLALWLREQQDQALE
ncbi:MAG: DUF2029 domain-containing protein [Armatimonadota bacterium]|nr:DUF2029 domain-containing protein [Armatimonadota bacterium]